MWVSLLELPVAVTLRMKVAPHQHFGPGVLALYATHIIAACGW